MGWLVFPLSSSERLGEKGVLLVNAFHVEMYCSMSFFALSTLKKLQVQ